MADVVSATVKDATKLISKTSTLTDDVAKIGKIASNIHDLAAVSILSTFANKGNVSTGRYYVQRTINVIGLFGLWYAGISIALLIVETSYGDDIEKFLRK